MHSHAQRLTRSPWTTKFSFRVLFAWAWCPLRSFVRVQVWCLMAVLDEQCNVRDMTVTHSKTFRDLLSFPIQIQHLIHYFHKMYHSLAYQHTLCVCMCETLTLNEFQSSELWPDNQLQLTGPRGDRRPLHNFAHAFILAFSLKIWLLLVTSSIVCVHNCWYSSWFIVQQDHAKWSFLCGWALFSNRKWKLR